MSESTVMAAGTVPAWDIADRMRKAMRVAQVGVQEMAEYLGVSRNTVGTWINGRIEPSVQTQRLWAMRCGVPFAWLKDGELPSGGPDDDGGRVAFSTTQAGIEKRKNSSLSRGQSVVVPLRPATDDAPAPFRKTA